MISKLSHLSLFPLCDTDTLKALCIQQEASIAAVWLENSRKWTFLRNLRRYGKRMLITITHSLDLHSTASRCKWADFFISTMMQCDRSAHTTCSDHFSWATKSSAIACMIIRRLRKSLLRGEKSSLNQTDSLRSWRDFARECCEPENASGEAVRGLVKSRVGITRGFASREFLAGFARDGIWRPARPLTHPASYAGYPGRVKHDMDSGVSLEAWAAPGKLTGCEHDLAHLVWQFRWKFFWRKKVQF